MTSIKKKIIIKWKTKCFFLDWRDVIFWVCWFLVETITSGTCLNSYEMIKTETSRCSKVTKLTYCILSTLIFLLCHRKEIKLKFTISFFQGVKVNLYRKMILSSIQKKRKLGSNRASDACIYRLDQVKFHFFAIIFSFRLLIIIIEFKNLISFFSA